MHLARFLVSPSQMLLLNQLYDPWTHPRQRHRLSVFLPAALRHRIQFAIGGAPINYSAVHGYDRTSYNMPEGVTNDQDVGAVDGVFAGWTASDLVATDVVALTLAIYGPQPTMFPKPYSDLMASSALARDYGYATFNLQRDSGQTGHYGEAYGHLGAT